MDLSKTDTLNNINELDFVFEATTVSSACQSDIVKLGATVADLVVSVKHMKIGKVMKDVKVLVTLIPEVKKDCTNWFLY